MSRANSDEGRERLRQMSVSLLTELMTPPDDKSGEAVGEHAITVDGLAGDLLEADAEGAVLFLGDLAVRAVSAYCEKTGADPLATLQEFARQT